MFVSDYGKRCCDVAFRHCRLPPLPARCAYHVSLATAFINLATQEEPYHIGFTFIMTKLYANSVLSSLNARAWFRPLATDTVELQRSQIESGTFATNSTSQTARQRPEVRNLHIIQPDYLSDMHCQVFVEIRKTVDRDSKHLMNDVDSETQSEWK